MWRGLLPTVAATFAVAAFPAAASAATAREDVFYPDYGGCKADCPDPIYVVVLVASPGERNDVTATRDPSGAVVLHDAGAAITAKRGCKSIDPNTVTCGSEYSDLRVTVRDGDDSVTIVDGFAKVEGGAGNDRLTGGSQADTLVGGPGNDELHGGAGDDGLIDGVARPRRGSANDDSFDGGDGRDRIDYAGRLFPVTIDLRPGATSGQRGERDALTGIEDALGGTAGDTIIGGDGPNDLYGGSGPGADVIRGGGGADAISSGPGDRTFGGPGADRFQFPRGDVLPGAALQRIDCGPDLDVIDYANLHTLVGDSCEVPWELSEERIRHHLPLASYDDPVLTYEQIDPRTRHIEVRASGVAAYRRHPRRGTLLAVGDTGYAKQLDLRLSDAGIALLRRYGRIRARVIVREYDVAYLIDLRPPAAASP
jgi:hypothetical protein